MRISPPTISRISSLVVLLAAALLLAPGLQPAAHADPCGLTAAPMCDGACPPGDMCLDLGGFCDCVPTAGPCGAVAGPPLCYGDCPPGMPLCVDAAGVCVCTVPTLSEWGILGMSIVMFGGVLYIRRRRVA